MTLTRIVVDHGLLACDRNNIVTIATPGLTQLGTRGSV
jgi:hypothetical protein